MENKVVNKPRTTWPSVFESGWMDKFFNAPLDEFFNYSKVINSPAVNVSETDKEFRLSIAAPGLEKKDFKDPALLGKLADMAKLTPEEFKARFERLLAHEPRSF